MKAIVLKSPGGTEQLRLQEIPVPVIREDEVLVQVKAISINPVDVKSRAGKGVYGRIKEIQPLILGWDISGIVTETGSAVKNFKKGDEVFGMVNFPGHGQAYAEYVAAPAAHLALKPGNISHDEAAAATLAALTAWQVIVDNMKIKAGQRILIHAAAGGVGHYAVQIAKHLGAYVIGTASTDNKEFILNLGADEHIDYRALRFEEVVTDVDFVLDTIGGENIDRSLEVIKKGGTLVSIPSGLNEAVTEKAKAKGINGYFTLVKSDGENQAKIAALLESGKLRSSIYKTYALEEMGAAHAQQETGKTRGKIVIRP